MPGKGKERATGQSRSSASRGEDGAVAGAVENLEGEQKFDITVDRERTVLDFLLLLCEAGCKGGKMKWKS